MERWFYTLAALLLLVFTFVGFKYFYLEGKAFPGRPLTPPIRGLIMAHGVMMTLWMVLALVQPLLVATRYRRVHMKLGVFAVVLACGMMFVGLRLGIEATRVNPPDHRLFGLVTKEFMAVPVVGIFTFGLFVLAGVIYRRQPAVHRPMMLMASIAIVSAALGRIPWMNSWYLGTWVEPVLTAHVVAVLVGAFFLAAKCLISRRLDRPFAVAFAALTVMSVVISLGARTQAWDQLATFLLR